MFLSRLFGHSTPTPTTSPTGHTITDHHLHSGNTLIDNLSSNPEQQNVDNKRSTHSSTPSQPTQRSTIIRIPSKKLSNVKNVNINQNTVSTDSNLTGASSATTAPSLSHHTGSSMPVQASSITHMAPDTVSDSLQLTAPTSNTSSYRRTTPISKKNDKSNIQKSNVSFPKQNSNFLINSRLASNLNTKMTGAVDHIQGVNLLSGIPTNVKVGEAKSKSSKSSSLITTSHRTEDNSSNKTDNVSTPAFDIINRGREGSNNNALHTSIERKKINVETELPSESRTNPTKNYDGKTRDTKSSNNEDNHRNTTTANSFQQDLIAPITTRVNINSPNDNVNNNNNDNKDKNDNVSSHGSHSGIFTNSHNNFITDINNTRTMNNDKKSTINETRTNLIPASHLPIDIAPYGLGSSRDNPVLIAPSTVNIRQSRLMPTRSYITREKQKLLSSNLETDNANTKPQNEMSVTANTNDLQSTMQNQASNKTVKDKEPNKVTRSDASNAIEKTHTKRGRPPKTYMNSISRRQNKGQSDDSSYKGSTDSSDDSYSSSSTIINNNNFDIDDMLLGSQHVRSTTASSHGRIRLSKKLRKKERKQERERHKHLFRRDINIAQAKDKNKVVLPAPRLIKEKQPKITIIPSQNNRQKANIMTLAEVQPFNPVEGRCIWHEEDTHRFGAIVATLTFKILMQIDDVLYPTSDCALDISLLEHLCSLLNGIPQSVKRYLNKNRDKEKYINNHKDNDNKYDNTHTKRINNDEVKLQKLIRTNNLYYSEMEFEKERENLRIVKEDEESDIMKNEIIANNTIQQVLASLHIKPDNTFYAYLESLKNNNLAPSSTLHNEQETTNEGGRSAEINQNLNFYSGINSISNENNNFNGMITNNNNNKTLQTLAPNEKKAVEGLVGRGNISQAAKKLKDSSNPTRSIEYDANTAFNTLCSLHHAEDDISSLTVEVSPIDVMNVEQYTLNSIEQMKEILDSLNKRSAADAAGWSVALIINIISRQPAVGQLIMRMINGCIIRQYWPDFLFISRMVAIPKPNDPGKYRPITITSIWRKLASKVMLKLHKSTLYKALAEGQYGVGTSYSAEIIVTSLQAAIDVAEMRKEELVITQLDLTNAYNLVDRARLLSTLKDIGLHPSAQYFFLSMFTKEKLYFYSRDKIQIVPNTRGVSQGDACSPILFSLYLSKVINDASVRAKNMLRNESSSASLSSSSSLCSSTGAQHVLQECNVPLVLSYLDDIFLVNPSLEHAKVCTHAILEDLRAVGMQPNVQKTCRLVRNACNISQSPSSSSIEEIQEVPSLKVLGSIITLRENERISFFIKKACNAINIMLSATQLRKQSFLLIARLCIASKLVHILRTLPLPRMLLSDFDAIVEALIINSLALPQSAMRELIFFPQQKGGLGLTALHQIQLIAALPLQAELLKLPHICRMTQILNGLSNLNLHITSGNGSILDNRIVSNDIYNNESSSSSSRINERKMFNHDGVDEPTDGKAGFASIFYLFEPFVSLKSLLQTTKNTPLVQHDLWMRQVENEYKTLLEKKMQTNISQYITLLATSKDSSCSRWLRSIPFSNYQKMSDEEFLHSIQYRLGVADEIKEIAKQQDISVFRGKKWKQRSSSSSSLSRQELNCPLCGYRMGEHHYANCQVTGPIRTARHNLIKRLLASTFMQLPATTVTVEDYFAGQGYKLDEELDDENEDAQGVKDTQSSSVKQTIPDITVFITDTKRDATKLERTLLDRHRDNMSLIKFSIDLTIADIHALSNEKDHILGNFAAAAEARKKKHYENYNRQHSVKCIPFGISSVGEFGPSARSIIEFINDMAKRHLVFINTNTLEEQISLLLETSRHEMENVYRQELIRRINLSAGYKHRMDSAAVILSPSLIAEQKGKKRTKVNAFWARQLITMQNFLRAKTTQNLSEQHAEELYHRLFNWIPESNNEPPDKGPPDKGGRMGASIRRGESNETNKGQLRITSEKSWLHNTDYQSQKLPALPSFQSNLMSSFQARPLYATLQTSNRHAPFRKSSSSSSISSDSSTITKRKSRAKEQGKRTASTSPTSSRSSSSSPYVPLFLQQMQKRPETNTKASPAYLNALPSYFKNISVHPRVTDAGKSSSVSSRDPSTETQNNDHRMNQATLKTISQGTSDIRSESSMLNIHSLVTSQPERVQHKASNDNASSNHATGNRTLSDSEEARVMKPSTSVNSTLGSQLGNAAVSSERSQLMTPGQFFINNSIVASTGSASTNSTVDNNPFAVVNTSSCSSSVISSSATSPGLPQGGGLQTGAVLGPSQQGALSNPFSSVAVPFYSSFTQHPLEQTSSLGKIAASNASINPALGQPPPSTNTNSAMPTHSSGW